MPANVSVTGDDALTLDMVGQYTYCPRPFHLMYAERPLGRQPVHRRRPARSSACRPGGSSASRGGRWGATRQSKRAEKACEEQAERARNHPSFRGQCRWRRQPWA